MCDVLALGGLWCLIVSSLCFLGLWGYFRLLALEGSQGSFCHEYLGDFPKKEQKRREENEKCSDVPTLNSENTDRESFSLSQFQWQ